MSNFVQTEELNSFKNVGMKELKPRAVDLEKLPDGLLLYLSDGTFKFYPSVGGGVIYFSLEEGLKMRLARISMDQRQKRPDASPGLSR